MDPGPHDFYGTIVPNYLNQFSIGAWQGLTALSIDYSSIGGGTAGAVLFENSSNQLSEDAANLFWDNSNNRLGIGTNGPGDTLEVFGGRILVSDSNTAGTAFALDAVPGGGNRIEFNSTGSTNGNGPGKFLIYDATADNVPLVMDASIFGLLPAQVFAWSDTSPYQIGTYDTGLSRIAPVVVGVGNGTQGDTSGIVLSDGNRGTVQIDFGSFPGTTDVNLAVSVPQIAAGSVVECFIMPAATADHSVDEHWLDPPEVFAGSISAGVGFTIYAKAKDLWGGVTGAMPTPADLDNLVYGKWQLGWRWS